MTVASTFTTEASQAGNLFQNDSITATAVLLLYTVTRLMICLAASSAPSYVHVLGRLIPVTAICMMQALLPQQQGLRLLHTPDLGI